MRVGIRFVGYVVIPCGLLFGACSESPNGPADQAELRLLHATPALGPVDVEVAGVTVIHSVAYGTASSLVQVPGGQQHLVVRTGNQILGELDQTLSSQHVNSVVVADGTPRFLAFVTPDTGQVISNRANIRMVNVVGPTNQPPTLLQILVKAPNPNPDSVATFGMDTRIASYGSLMYFDPGHFTFKFVPSGGSTVLVETSFDVGAGEKKAVVLERDANGTYRVQVIVEQ
jgi:uncharacterized protein DUF4397